MLGWEPEVSFEQLIRMMVDADVALLGRGVSGPSIRGSF